MVYVKAEFYLWCYSIYSLYKLIGVLRGGGGGQGDQNPTKDNAPPPPYCHQDS